MATNIGEESTGNSPNGTTVNSTSSSLKAIDESLKLIIKPQSQLINIALDENNYLLWKFQIETAARGYGLSEYINGTIQVPPKVIINSEGTAITNQEYTLYLRQDSLISSWLISSISPNLISQVIGCTTSHEIWKIIQQSFNTQSSAKIMHLKRQLQQSRKGDLSIREYLTM